MNGENRTMETIETMTPEEATKRMRAAGMKISPTVVRDGLKQKVFPFGDAIESDRSFRFFVYTKLLEKWIAERAQDSA